MKPRILSLFAGCAVLVGVWGWPLPGLPLPPFSQHMTIHMSVVAVAAPLLSLGMVGGAADCARRWPRLCSAIPASMLELVAVWVWHAPALHHHARTSWWAFGLEQATFLAAGLWLWLAALGGAPNQRRARSLSGAVALLLTSMHMTLLGALLALTPRVLYSHHTHGTATFRLAPLQDQQLGGAIMIAAGLFAYSAGGLYLTAQHFHPQLTKGRLP